MKWRPQKDDDCERRLAELTAREAALKKITDVMQARAEQAEARVAELEAQLAEAEAPADSGRPTLRRLEALVADAKRRGAPEAEEWSVYVPLLRDHAAPDGTIPAQFDSLIEQVFGSAL